MDAEQTGIGAAIGVAATAVTGMFVKLIGSKKDRGDDRAQATEEWRTIALAARADHDECIRRQNLLNARIDELRDSVVELTLEHGRCPARIEALEHKVRQLQESRHDG